MDAFYASVELLRRPELRGKPVVVCGSGPRAVVTTASYEARKLAGIHSAMPAATARRRCRTRSTLRPDFPAYREASAPVMEMLRRNIETVEVVGLDEAYLDLSGLVVAEGDVRRLKAEIRARDRAHLLGRDLPEPAAGEDPSELGKPAGFVVLSREAGAGALRRRVAGLMPGIGPKTVVKLERMGIRSVAELGARDAAELGTAFGPRSGAWLHARAPARRDADHGRTGDASRSRPRSPSTSTSATRRAARRTSVELAEELCRRLRQARARGRTIGIKVRLDDWTNVTRSQTRRGADQRPGGGRRR